MEHSDFVERITALSQDQRDSALFWLAGYRPDAVEQALGYVARTTDPAPLPVKGHTPPVAEEGSSREGGGSTITTGGVE